MIEGRCRGLSLELYQRDGSNEGSQPMFPLGNHFRIVHVPLPGWFPVVVL